MALEDKIKWDKRYLNNHPISDEPIDLVKYYFVLAPIGLALDIACGRGRHSKFLAQNNFMVDALDISAVALDSISNIDNINTRDVDLDNFEILPNSYDLIICTYYLNRDIFDSIYSGLKDGAIVIYETFVYHADNSKVPSKKEFLLEENELKNSFDNLEIIFYDEWWDITNCGDKALKASLVGRKIGGIPTRTRTSS